MLLIITGCSNKQVVKHNYIYRGENEFWTAEYRVDAVGIFKEDNGNTNYKSESNTTLTVTYKKNLSELLSVKHLEISYESSAKGGKLTDNFDSTHPIEKTYTLKSSGSGVAIEHKDERIKVNINIDGKIQTIELKNVHK